MKKSLLLLALGLLTPAIARAEINVKSAAVGTGIEEHELVGKASSFGADVGKVYLHTAITGDFGETKLEHVWKREGTEVSRVALTAKSPGPWRTWSYKTIPEWATGSWTVDVVDSEGKVLQTVSFSIGEGGGKTAGNSMTDKKPVKKEMPTTMKKGSDESASKETKVKTMKKNIKKDMKKTDSDSKDGKE